MSQIDLSQSSFIIPYKWDSAERHRNLRAIVDYLQKHFITNIFVWEEGEQQTYTPHAGVDYTFVRNTGPIFHRTKILNNLTKKTVTPVVFVYDTDVLLDPDSYSAAQDLIIQQGLDMVFPYDGRFLNVHNPALINYVIQELSIKGLNIETDTSVNHPNSVGGAIAFKRSSYFRFGLENENFISWGFEDNCRISRMAKLGAKVVRVRGPLFHLDHPASTNSANTNHQPYFDNQREYMKVANMTPEQLTAYVNSWPWRYDD
jgi:predicted glycosyltransferase involved in capsule biosynthesis